MARVTKGWAPEVPETRHLAIQSASTIFSAEPPEWLDRRLAAARGVGLLNGPSGSGKTYVAVDAAMAVANGHAIREQPSIRAEGRCSTQPGKTVQA